MGFGWRSRRTDDENANFETTSLYFQRAAEWADRHVRRHRSPGERRSPGRRDRRQGGVPRHRDAELRPLSSQHLHTRPALASSLRDGSSQAGTAAGAAVPRCGGAVRVHRDRVAQHHERPRQRAARQHARSHGAVERHSRPILDRRQPRLPDGNVWWRPLGVLPGRPRPREDRGSDRMRRRVFPHGAHLTPSWVSACSGRSATATTTSSS